MQSILHINRVSLLVAGLLALPLAHAQAPLVPPAPIGPDLNTEWVEPAATEPPPPAPTPQLPEGTVLQEGMILPPGTVLPGGAILPPESATPAPTVEYTPTPVPMPEPQPEPTVVHPLPAPAPTPAPPPRRGVGPSVQVMNGVSYISGGIGVSEREELQAMKSQFNLRLLFAVTGSGSYLADVRVRIDDAAGGIRLDALSEGPWFYAKLTPGRYILQITSAGQVQRREVSIPASGALEQAFYWND
ncbi:hypothetical protein SAMN05421644_13518 [Allochromatium warmingii]|uniref:Carboxypeptidase regulatory-like domain-containing protein n=1 Tax=Allochromatium warmingii TaxID=61595 RepID=A0A1H3HPG9_ALLWA|nr:hypothetical protein [Allochromatium warmingii]SDY17280.1 hypothetical protein SAMN05421644_13518 [Allochromatium warmingii]